MKNRKVIWLVLVFVAILWAETSLAKKSGKSKTGTGWGSNTNNRNTGGTNTNNWNTGGSNPSNPNTRNTGGTWTNWNSGTNWNAGANRGPAYNPQGGSNFNKQWKPPKSKPNMKMVAGAAAAGAVAGGIGGYMLGSAMGRTRYSFDNPDDSYYYNHHAGRMPDRVYRPNYIDNRPVTEDRFVTDCYNMSATEYIYKSDESKNGSDIDPVEMRVKSHVITQMCRSEYRMGNGVRGVFSDPLMVISVLLLLYFVVQ